MVRVERWWRQNRNEAAKSKSPLSSKFSTTGPNTSTWTRASCPHSQLLLHSHLPPSLISGVGHPQTANHAKFRRYPLCRSSLHQLHGRPQRGPFPCTKYVLPPSLTPSPSSTHSSSHSSSPLSLSLPFCFTQKSAGPPSQPQTTQPSASNSPTTNTAAAQAACRISA